MKELFEKKVKAYISNEVTFEYYGKDDTLCDVEFFPSKLDHVFSLPEINWYITNVSIRSLFVTVTYMYRP